MYSLLATFQPLHFNIHLCIANYVHVMVKTCTHVTFKFVAGVYCSTSYLYWHIFNKQNMFFDRALNFKEVPYIANRLRWKSFAVFMDRLVLQNFSSEIACTCAIGLAMQDYHPTVNVGIHLKHCCFFCTYVAS